MQQKELLTAILNDYVKERVIDDPAQLAIESFCVYVNSWFKNNPPVGLSHAVKIGRAHV